MDSSHLNRHRRALHRIRTELVRQRTAKVNQIRGLPDMLEDAENGLMSDFRALLAGLREDLVYLRFAIEATASKNPTYFTRWVQANQDMEYMAVQRLVAHGFSVSPEAYAEQAYKWLFADLRRLQLGDSRGSRMTTATLISAVSPFWKDQQVREFESNIQKYRPATPTQMSEVNQRRNSNKFVRTTKAHLLTALPPSRLSEKSKKLIATEKRALGEDLDSGIHHLGSGMIGSPMSADEMVKAKDRDILKIFKDVPDKTNWDHPKHWMRGGNIQLSRAFSEFAKKDTTRALRIMEQFESNIQERAAGYALESIAELASHDQEVQATMLDLYKREFGSEEFRTSAASALEKIAKRQTQIDPNLVDVLSEWLKGPKQLTDGTDEDDASEVDESRDHSRSKDSRLDSILWGHGGLSILPGGNFPILSALTFVLLKQKEAGRDRLVEVLKEHLLREKTPKIWQALLIRLSNAGGSTPEGLSSFLRALFLRHPSLLETREAVYFLACAYQWDERLVHDLIKTWEHAANPMLRQAQGELVGLISTVQGSALWTAMREQLFAHGSPEAKVGMAYAGANLWSERQFHRDAGSLLERLIPGADNHRMSAILDVFRLSSDLVPEPTTLALLKALSATDVDLAGAPSNFVVDRLQSLLPHAADIVGRIAVKLVTAWGSGLGDSQTATSLVAPQLTDLAITLHRLGGDSRDTGVAVFEKLIEIDAYGARDTLIEIDGRFGFLQTGARRRISRRRANRAKSRAF